VVNVSGTIEQNINSRNFAGEIANVVVVADVEPANSNGWPLILERCEQRLVNVRRPNLGSFICECNSRGTPDALPRGGCSAVFLPSLPLIPVP